MALETFSGAGGVDIRFFLQFITVSDRNIAGRSTRDYSGYLGIYLTGHFACGDGIGRLLLVKLV